MAERRTLRVAAAAAAAAAALTIAACGSASGTGGKAGATVQRSSAATAEHQIDIYSSLPRSGPQAAEGIAIEQGIRTGLSTLEQPVGRIEQYKIVYKPLNDANRAGWSATLAAANAEKAASDANAALYIGDFNSGATEASLPILNQAGIVAITPGSGYAGLTNSIPGVTLTGEPDRYYPDPRLRNLLRLIPSEMVQISAILDAFATVGPCTRVAAVSFGGTAEGASAVLATQATAKDYGMTFVPATTKPLPAAATQAELTAYVESLHSQTVGCLVLSGRKTATAKALVRLLRADLPHVPVIATSAYCGGSLGSPGWYCMSPVLPLSKYAGGQLYANDYAKVYSTKRVPSSYGVYGFIAAELAVSAIDEVEGGDVRTQLQHALLGGELEELSQIIGTIEFDADGNIDTDRRVGLYRDGPGGQLQLLDVISPSVSKIVGGA